MEHIAPLLGHDPSQWTPGRLTYQLRRLRLHGLIQRIAGTNRYEVTERGYRIAFGSSVATPEPFALPSANFLLTSLRLTLLRDAIERFDKAVQHYPGDAKMGPQLTERLDSNTTNLAL